MFKETQHIEFKPNFNEDVIETLVAFANAKKTKTQSQIVPDWNIIDYNGNEIVEFFVQEYPIKPVSTRGRYYKRVGNYTSKSRNKLIAQAFKEVGIIERFGSGIIRVRNICEDYGIKEPEFNEILNGFQVILYNEKSINKKKKIERIKDYPEKTVEKILIIISNNPQITQKELAEITGLTKRGIDWNLTKLKSKGLIERIGPDHGGYWKVIEKANTLSDKASSLPKP